jgi:hypothetical protein
MKYYFFKASPTGALKIVSAHAEAKRMVAIYCFELTDHETAKPRESSSHVQIGIHT